ncbi:hypothetical protein R50072_26810 [Simiduia litorea]|uniref:chaperone NapD n=1 Tax=Simiduia litorea TaxID=1435348 RepID=UPI0036F1BEA7
MATSRIEPAHHIASLVIQFKAEHRTALHHFIDNFTGAEIGVEENSKMVILITSESQQTIVDFIDQVQLRTGVLSANLVYHFSEAETSTQGAQHETA